MSKEILLAYDSGLTVYFQIFNSTSQVWNGASFETYATANIATYKIAGTEAGTASGYYTANFPAAVAGVYSIVARVQSGGSAAETDVLAGTQSNFQWSGTAAVPLYLAPVDLQTIKTQTVTCSAGVTVGPYVGNATAAIVVSAAGGVTLADGVAHGGTLGSSTATLALSRINVTSQTINTSAVTLVGNGTGSGLDSTGKYGVKSTGTNAGALFQTGSTYCYLADAENGHYGASFWGSIASVPAVFLADGEDYHGMSVIADEGSGIYAKGDGSSGFSAVSLNDGAGIGTGSVAGYIKGAASPTFTGAGVHIAAEGANGIETGISLKQAMRIVGAAVAGKCSGGPSNPVFIGLDGATTRLTGVADSSGNRSVATYSA